MGDCETLFTNLMTVQSISKQRRANFRSVVLNEDVKAVSRPECHARGLIPFCHENPRLRIERRISLLTNLLPPGSDYVSGYEDEFIYSEDCFQVLLPWIDEALLLPSFGMPLPSFQLVVDGDARESSEFWHMLKYAAATQQARRKQLQLSGTDLPTGELRPIYDGDYAVWDFPSGFARMVRDIYEGNSVVRYNGDVGEVWDEDTFFSERKDWTELQWETDWNETVDQGIVSNFWPKISERYLKERLPC